MLLNVYKPSAHALIHNRSSGTADAKSAALHFFRRPSGVDPDADLGLHDHINIIRAVANRCDGLG